MIELRPILLVAGVLLATLGCAMMIPALYDLTIGHEDWQIFAASATITLFVGIGLAFANRGRTEHFSIKQAFLLTNVCWLSLTAFGALPFVWSTINISYTDAFFESMSGITTTGATVLSGLDKLPPGILLWRALLQWLGGLGIIVMAISILPMLQIGGMQLFKVEAFDTAGKVLPRATQIASSLVILYIAFTFACASAYYLTGMTVFDAIIHSMTTLATGGFSSHDASLAYFATEWVEVVAIIFMMIGSLPFVLYVKAYHGKIGDLIGNSQVRWFFGTIAIFSILAWFSYQSAHAEAHETRIITVIFNVVSVMTGTGYATTAYDNWSAMAVVLFFMLMFVGGCSGSTACGIKIFRFQVMFEMIRVRVKSVIYPDGVFIEQYNGLPLSDTVMNAVMAVFFGYLFCFAISAGLLSVMGLDTITAMSAAATAISNVGPGLGPIVGPVGNFAPLPDAAKWVLSITMLIGRLEIFTVIVLFTPTYWRV
ncbi:MAG: TrkH family potassium uptake protein [Methyloligellaceae bacterium]